MAFADDNDENIRIPEMEIRDQLRGMAIGSIGSRADREGASATLQGTKRWTIAEVRKQVQSLVKK